MSSRESIREVYLAPVILCCLMVACALTTGELANVSSRALFIPYLATSIAITFVSILLSVFWWVLQLARIRADAPLKVVKLRVRERAPYLMLPAIMFPLFFASFTATKTAIPFLVGYSWDPTFAHADRLIFGDDAWRIAHHWLGNGAALPLEWFYSFAWGLALIFVMALVPMNASRRFTVRFYTAMLTTWLVVGVALAYLLPSAGPVFAHLVNSDPTDQFTDLRKFLDGVLPVQGPIRTTQDYLAYTVHSHVAVRGGGISAMPSMHLGVVSIYVLAARRTPWFLPAVLFWTTIFVCSAYFGYHYWVDGIVASAVAGACWVAVERLSQQKAGELRRVSREKGVLVGALQATEVF